MSGSNKQRKIHVPSRSTSGTTPAHRKAVSNIARTKLEQVYQQSERDALPVAEQPFSQNQPRSRDQLLQQIDRTPGDQLPKLNSQPPAAAVNKTYLDKYHQAWQAYYQKYYADYYTKGLRETARNLKRQKAVGQLSKAAVKREEFSEKTAARKLRHEVIYRAKKTTRAVKRSRHFRPILAGVIAALLILLIQFNQLLTGAVAAFVAPSETSQQPLLIASISNTAVTAENILVIPKLGLESPLVFDAASSSEADMQTALERGVVHYDLPQAHSLPGEKGNAVFLGHSAGDVFYGGEYKYIFSKLNRLAPGDSFYINYNQKRYIYKVDRTTIIKPTELDALYNNDGLPWVILVTCDPPGSSLRRLLVYAQQISPDPKNGGADSQKGTTAAPQDITGKTPTLFERIFAF